MFASFDIYDNCHPVSEDLMKDIATYAIKSLDINKPIRLHGITFSSDRTQSE